MTKIHFVKSPDAERTVCRRYIGSRTRTTQDAFRVQCKDCKKTTAWFTALAHAQAARKAAFEAQVPHHVSEPWKAGSMVCSNCQGTLFRYKGRSCSGHYDDHVCASCGHTESRYTETGMSF